MKKSILAIVTFMVIHLAGNSQPPSVIKPRPDGCPTEAEMQKALRVYDSLQVMKREVVILNTAINQATESLFRADKALAQADSTQKYQSKYIDKLEKETVNLSKQNSNNESRIGILETKVMKKNKAIIKLVGINIVFLGAIGYLVFLR